MDYRPIYAAELVLWSVLSIPINGGVPLLMKCLSVRQPWAWVICSGEKRIENRTWSTNFRGTVAIHAGSSKAGINELRRRVKFGTLDESTFPLGAVVGVADIVDCLPLNEQLEEDPWAQGPICWILEKARRLEKPIPMKGKLNLFSLPTEVAEQVESQLGAPCRKQEPVDSQLLTCLLDPPEERWLIQMSAYVELNQMDPVLRLANRYISQFPDVGIGYRFRAAAHLQLGDGGAALVDANHAIELDPRTPVLTMLGPWCRSTRVTSKQHAVIGRGRESWERIFPHSTQCSFTMRQEA